VWRVAAGRRSVVRPFAIVELINARAYFGNHFLLALVEVSDCGAQFSPHARDYKRSGAFGMIRAGLHIW